MQQAQKEEEATIRSRPTGVPCTAETFAAWWAKFKAERDADLVEEEVKPTGRALFEGDSKMNTSDAAVVGA